MRLGPKGLIELLMGRLGLSHPATSEPVRTARYLQALVSVDSDWCRSSLQVDPWGTAQSILALRDAAVEGGADLTKLPESALANFPRLKTLADVEKWVQRECGLPPSFADDSAEVARRLKELAADSKDAWPLEISEITVEGGDKKLPGLWASILDSVAGLGVRVKYVGNSGRKPQLKQLERVLCPTEFEGAVVAAEYLKKCGCEVGQILATSPTLILDGQLLDRDLPALGVAQTSAAQPLLQILPLVLGLRIRDAGESHPIEVLGLYELLGTALVGKKEALFPGKVKHQLRTALERVPSAKSEEFEKALANAHDDTADAKNGWVPDLEDFIIACSNPDQPSVRKQCEQILNFLGRRVEASVRRGEPEIRKAARRIREQMSTFGQVVESLDDTLLSRHFLVELAVQCAPTETVAPKMEAASWEVVEAPSHLLSGQAGTTLWWGASGTAPGVSNIWDEGENALLSSVGMSVLSPAEMSALQTEAEVAAFLDVSELVAFIPARSRGESVKPSPLLQYLADPDTGLRVKEEVSADEFLYSRVILGEEGRKGPKPPPTLLLGKRDKPKQEAEGPIASPGTESRGRQLPDGLTSSVQIETVEEAASLMPDSLSATQGEALLECTLCWVLDRRLGVRRSGSVRIPTGNQAVGTLIHSVVEKLVNKCAARDKEAIEEAFDEMVETRASFLLQPGQQARREAIREAAVAAVADLFRQVDALSVTSLRAEVKFEEGLKLPAKAKTDGRPIKFTGSRDLSGNMDDTPVVIDLKWSNSKSRFAFMVKEQRTAQLAAYSWAISQERKREDEPSVDALVAYYLLKQRHFEPRDWNGGHLAADVTHVWQAFVNSLGERLDLLSEGIITSVPGTSAGSYYNQVTENRCAYSDTAGFCGGKNLK